MTNLFLTEMVSLLLLFCTEIRFHSTEIRNCATACALITRNLGHFVRVILLACGVLKVLRSMSEGVNWQKQQRLLRLCCTKNNLSSANFEIDFKGKRKYKPGEKLHQVEKLVSGHSDEGSNHYQEWCSWERLLLGSLLLTLPCHSFRR